MRAIYLQIYRVRWSWPTAIIFAVNFALLRIELLSLDIIKRDIVWSFTGNDFQTIIFSSATSWTPNQKIYIFTLKKGRRPIMLASN